ncbi:MAG: SDR family NAD(P)-dependent oxidoreductase [Bacteroidota bacterium]
MKIARKNIILTGAASGIGKALLMQLLDFEGINIVAVDLNEVEVISPKITPFICDLSQQIEIDRLFKFALSHFQTIDIFIANAGFAYYEEINKPDWQRIELIFQVNVFSPIYAFQKMKELNIGREYFVLITSSAMAKVAIPGYALYGATKAALDRFEDAYRFERQDLGHLSLIYPIATKTNFFHRSANFTRRDVPFPAHTPQEVAKAMIKGILQNETCIFPSKLFQIGRFFQKIFEIIVLPYQYFYAKKLKNWLK